MDVPFIEKASADPAFPRPTFARGTAIAPLAVLFHSREPRRRSVDLLSEFATRLVALEVRFVTLLSKTVDTVFLD